MAIYGEIDIVERARGFLPVGLADGVRVTRAICRGEPVPITAVELDRNSTLIRLRDQHPVMPQPRGA